MSVCGWGLSLTTARSIAVGKLSAIDQKLSQLSLPSLRGKQISKSIYLHGLRNWRPLNVARNICIRMAAGKKSVSAGLGCTPALSVTHSADSAAVAVYKCLCWYHSCHVADSWTLQTAVDVVDHTELFITKSLEYPRCQLQRILLSVSVPRTCAVVQLFQNRVELPGTHLRISTRPHRLQQINTLLDQQYHVF